MDENDSSVSDRLRRKELGRGRNKPSFGLIVALAAVVLLIGLATAVFLVHEEGRRMIPQKPHPEPHSRLLYPATAPNRPLA